MAGRLNFAQKRALLAVYRGPVAIDAHMLRGLSARGLIVVALAKHRLAVLTFKGFVLAEGYMPARQRARGDIGCAHQRPMEAR